ncbi:MAG: TSUP family transporter [Betaproteobacteria bacterium]|nr:TSUP family transporter [Betaproteobacteria bacterium]
MDLSLSAALLLPLVATFAGFIDTLAGGGGLVTVPALLLAGVPPLNALATNKVQGSMGTLTASLMLMRKGFLRPEEIRRPLLYCFFAAGSGTALVQALPAPLLRYAIPLVLIGIATYFLLVPAAGQLESRPRLGLRYYQSVILPVIAFYDGLIGPGTGSFFSLAGVALRGQTLIQATAHAKAFNFISNLASVGVFVLGGHVLWFTALSMMLGQMLGATIASHVMIRGGARLIRPLIVMVSLAMLLRFWLTQ